MKLGKILNAIGGFTDSPIGEALQQVVPGLGVVDMVLDAVNGIGEGGLTANSPVSELVNSVNVLPDNMKLEFLEKELDLKIVEAEKFAEVAIAQEQSNNTTRPQIAMKMAEAYIGFAKYSFQLMAFAILMDVFVAVQDVNVIGGESITKIVMAGLAWFAAAYAIPMMNVIVQYFAKRSDDKRTAMSGTGVTVPGAAPGLIAQIAGMFKKN